MQITIYRFGIVKQILNFSTCRLMAVFANGALSQKWLSSKGSPQGYVLSSLLNILYINEWGSDQYERHLLKFADDTVLITLFMDGDGQVLENFFVWYYKHFLKLNVHKAKDMAIKFRKTFPQPSHLQLRAHLVEYYKYLATDENLNFDLDSFTICKDFIF